MSEEIATDSSEATESKDPVASLTEDLQRLQAEYSNYKKRVDRDFDYSEDAYLPYKVSRIARRGIDLDAIPEISSDNIKYIKRVYPIMTGESNAVVSWRFGSSQSPDGTITWTPWSTYQVQGGVKVDTRITGRYLAFEMECPATDPGGWGLTGLDIDVSTAGGR